MGSMPLGQDSRVLHSWRSAPPRQSPLTTPSERVWVTNSSLTHYRAKKWSSEIKVLKSFAQTMDNNSIYRSWWLGWPAAHGKHLLAVYCGLISNNWLLILKDWVSLNSVKTTLKNKHSTLVPQFSCLLWVLLHLLISFEKSGPFDALDIWLITWSCFFLNWELYENPYML